MAINGRTFSSYSPFFPLFSQIMASLIPFPEESQTIERSSAWGTCTILYSNMHLLWQAFGELCKICFFIIFSWDSCYLATLLTTGYVIAMHLNRTIHNGGILILLFVWWDWYHYFYPTWCYRVSFHLVLYIVDCLLLLSALSVQYFTYFITGSSH